MNDHLRQAPSTALRSAPPRGLALALTLGSALGLSAPGLATPQDPFAMGERWAHAPSATETAWMPDQVLFAGDESFVWTSVRGGTHSLRVLDSVATGSQSARGVVMRAAGEFGAPLIAAGERGDRVFAMRQFNAPTAFQRQPLVSGFDPAEASGGATMSAAWDHDLDVRINGPIRLAADDAGAIVAAAAWDNTTASVRVDILNGTDGTLLGRRDLPAFSLNGLAVSGDGTRIAVSAGLTMYVLDATGTPLFTHSLSAATQAVDLSLDGSVLAFGELGAMSIYQEQAAGGYSFFQRPVGSSEELPSALELSDDGSFVAVAWWNYVNGAGVRFEIYDTIFQFALASWTQPSFTGAVQNLPVAARITDDGNRAAFATWGNGSAPEVIVLELAGFSPAFQVDLPGSARGLDFDASGSRVVVGHKDVHSQTFGASGAVRVIDSGERRLALTSTPELGGTLEAAAISPGSFGGWFVLGPKADVPTQFPGVSGLLLLKRDQLTVLGRLADANGRIDLSLPIPNDPSMVGQQMHVQAAFRTMQGLAFTDNIVSPVIVR